MKILLTGGAGFIGSHLVQAFLKKGHQVVVVDNLSHGNHYWVDKRAKFYQVDICDFAALERVFAKEKPQVVNHHAAEIRLSASGIKVFRNNVLGTLNLLKLGKKYKIGKFIFASSAAVYGETKRFPIKESQSLRPISEYGISKLTAEFYINIFRIFFKTILFRYSNVYGPRQDASGEGGVVAIFAKRIMQGRDCFIYGDGKQTRDFVFVDDVVRANLRALRGNFKGVFNIATSRQTNIIQLFELVKKIVNKNVKVKFKQKRIGEIERSVLANSLAKKILNWKSKYSLEEGLKRMIRNIDTFEVEKAKKF